MRARTAITLLAVLGSVLLLASSASAAMVGIYRNGLETLSQRSQLVKLSGKECARRGAESGLQVTLGKATPECAYRTPVVGRDVEVGATERLLATTPKRSQHKAYLGLALRSGSRARFELRVFPLQRKLQLLKIVAGEISYLAVVRKEMAVKGLGEANAMRLRAIDGAGGVVKLRAYLGNRQVAEATDEEGGSSLPGQFGGVVLGALKSPNGVSAGVDDVIVRVPVRF